ncbi:uncharacterized protein LOC142979317 [Anticarsia gemmatalis]|uniref:uncharacterized protein LOC142979317 n=1 Tax=Anticarsia gemmatalis TaxID=129554 RepID=UPI003F7756D3
MFNTENLIVEIHKRECLWNKNHPNYGNATFKRAKWEEIGAVIYAYCWETLTAEERHEKVLEMTKKWRNVRDYYIKEKRKQQDSTSTDRLRHKKRLYNYFKILTFLDNRKVRKRKNSNEHDLTVYSDHESVSSSNEEQENDEQINETIHEETPVQIKEETPIQIQRPKPITTIQKRFISTLNKPRESGSRVAASRNFLLSLMPDVESLSEQQYMSFRLAVLNLLNDFKYGGHEAAESWVISTMGDGNVCD